MADPSSPGLPTAAPRRGARALASVALTALALTCAAQILSELYLRLASRALEDGSLATAARAAELAGRLAPLSSQALRLQGWTRAETGDAAIALQSYERALRRSPGDALLWTEYAQVRARLGRFDETTAGATANAWRLGAQTPAVVRAIAEQGLTYWDRGSPDLHAHWLDAIRRQHSTKRADLLSAVLTRGRLSMFCGGPASTLGESAWCEAARGLKGCFDITPQGPRPCRR